MGTGGFATLCEPHDITVVGRFTPILKDRFSEWGWAVACFIMKHINM